MREILEGDFADTCARNNPLMLIGGRVESLACAYMGLSIIDMVQVQLDKDLFWLKYIAMTMPAIT